jgi:isoleucyl-tRNA synthetase
VLKDYDAFQFHLIYQRVHNFCSVDMGAFYLDVIKDRLYTMQENSHARRSAQTAMYHVLEALVRWIAPILSFTAEEIWSQMPGERSESVLFETWYTGLPEERQGGPFTMDYWQRVLEVRDHVARELEALRNEGKIGSGLGAEVDIYTDGDLLDDLAVLEDELRFVLITSDARIHAAEGEPSEPQGEVNGTPLRIEVVPATAEKCQRCWHLREDVGANENHPELCGRCVSNVDGPGETRRFA